jgi:fimbrial chaperone protein
MFLDREAKSSVITVINEADEKLNLQVKAMEWTEDAEGKDVYRDTTDIVFFPRILLIGTKEQKIIRVGIKAAPTAQEKTYRLFIEEIPQPKKEEQGERAQVSIAVRFGAPIFVKPLKEEVRGELSNSALGKGVFTTTVRNTGNSHFKISTITISGKNIKGEETFTAKLDGWYLLNGAARTYSTPVPMEKCTESAQLDITVTTDKQITLNGNLNVEKAQCLP